jgi:hypothetical protein
MKSKDYGTKTNECQRKWDSYEECLFLEGQLKRLIQEKIHSLVDIVKCAFSLEEHLRVHMRPPNYK